MDRAGRVSTTFPKAQHMTLRRRVATISRRLSTRQGRREVIGAILFGAFGWAFNRNRSMFLVNYRPDFDHDHGQLDAFPRFRSDWIKGNAANNLGDLTRLHMLALNLGHLIEENIPGDFAELGVYKGNSAKILAEFSRRAGRKLYLFDTFSGFDPRETRRLAAEVAAAFRDTNLEAVTAFVGKKGVVYIPGLFPESLRGGPELGNFALVHVDCDLYEPMKAGLEFFYGRMSRGGMFILHDYASGHWPGIRRAVDEFLLDKPERLVLIPDKSGTAILRKA